MKLQAPAFSQLEIRSMRSLYIVIILGIATHTFWFVKGVERRSQDHLTGVIDYVETGDVGGYVVLARNLRFNHVFGFEQSGPVTPTYFRAPGYPFLIAALWLTGASPPTKLVLFVQALLGIGTAVLVYFIGIRFGVALLAGAAMAVAPMSGVWTGELMSETLYTFLMALALFLWLRESYNWAGFLFGLSWLVRPTTMAFLAFILLVSAFRPRLRRAAVIMTTLACLTVLPWVIRNLIVFHEFIPVAIAGGRMNLLSGTFDIPYHTNIWTEWRKEPSLQTGYSWDDPRNEDIYLKRAIERIKANPAQWIVIRIKQYPRLLIDLGSYLYPQSRVLTLILKYIFLTGNIAVLLLALWGGYLTCLKPELTLFPIFTLLFHLPLWVDARYSLPMMPIVIVLAAIAASSIAQRVRLNFT